MLLLFDDFIKDFFVLAVISGIAYFCGYAARRAEERAKDKGDKGGHY